LISTKSATSDTAASNCSNPIEKHGSIAEAAKAMSMSYRRAWYLAESINSTFADPAVERQHGGKGGGSARLTAFGKSLVRDYRAMERATLKSCAKQLRNLERHLGAPKDFRP
jgi:molybdate transport system regulatory protein